MKQLLNTRLWQYGLFWSWNMIFLAFMLLGFAPTVLPEMITAVQAGIVPGAFLVYALGLTIIPILTIIVALTRLRRSPERLFALGYAVEGPLMLVLALRFFVVREITTTLALLLGAAALGMAAFLWQLLDQRIDSRHPVWQTLRLVGLSFFAVVAIYASVWVLFYVIPLAVGLVRGLVEWLTHFDLFLRDVWRMLNDVRAWTLIPFMVLGMLLVVYSATLFVLLPFTVPILVLRAWLASFKAFAARVNLPAAAVLSATTVAACALLFVVTNRQPQQYAFQLLETPPTTEEQAQAIAQQETAIRDGLLNAYLAPSRYVSAVGEVNHVRELYHAVVGLDSTTATQVEQWYEMIASPLLYVPVHPKQQTRGDGIASADQFALTQEPSEAAELYKKYFDTTIVEGEQGTIENAVRSTWSIAQAQQAAQTVEDREVHLVRQEISVQEHGNWAEIELYEAYQNETATRQEVVYYFTLPESAVITGVWLGTSDDRSQRYPYQVAPRGAAQAVYRNEIRRNMDPALVEQIGPRQYRLRVFPVEPKGVGFDNANRRSFVRQGPPLHMWLT